MQKGSAQRVWSCVCVCMLITFYVQSFKRKITNTFKNRAYALMLMMLGFIYETLNLSRWLLFEHHLREGGPCRARAHITSYTHIHIQLERVRGRKTDSGANSHVCVCK